MLMFFLIFSVKKVKKGISFIIHSRLMLANTEIRDIMEENKSLEKRNFSE